MLGRMASSIGRVLSSDRQLHGEYYAVPDHLPVLPVILAQADIWFLFSVYVTAVVWPMASPSTRTPPSSQFYANSDIIGLLVTAFLLSLTLVSFVLASITDPGRVPRQWPWDPSKTDPTLGGTIAHEDYSNDDDHKPLLARSSSSSSVRGLEKKRDGRTRFCQACHVYKPDRTHHCRKLGRCVLEMDHWCGWVRNTIGYRNKKYFFLLINYASATLLCYLVTLGPYVVDALVVPRAQTNALNVFVCVAWFLALVQFVAIASFAGFHAYLAACGFTTIEFREKRGAKEETTTITGAKVSELYESSPYDVGKLGNLKHILGSNVILWLVPTRFGMPDGPTAGALFSVRPDHPLARQAKVQEHQQAWNRKLAEGGEF
jgi:hypothetical protein